MKDQREDPQSSFDPHPPKVAIASTKKSSKEEYREKNV